MAPREGQGPGPGGMPGEGMPGRGMGGGMGRGGMKPHWMEKAKPRKGSVWGMYKRMFFHIRTQWPLIIVAFFCILALSGLAFVTPHLTQFTIDRIIPDKRYDLLIWIGFGVIGAAALRGIINYISSLAMATVGQTAVFQLRNELYGHIQSMDVEFFDKNRTGDLMSRVTNDVNMLQQLISSGMISIVTDFVTFIAVACYMLWIDWQLTLIILVTFPFMIWTTRFFSARIRSTFRKVQESVAEVSNHLQDTLSSIRLIKSFTNERYESERFTERNRDNMSANMGAVRLRAKFEPVIDMLNAVGLGAVLLFGAMRAMDGHLTVGTVVAFTAYLRLLQNPIRAFTRTINTIQQSAAAYDRIVDVLNTKPKVTEKAGAKELAEIKGHIVFDRVTFSYQPDVPVLHHFNFEVKPGEVTAIVGSSGAGKSTITHLITRFYDPQEGSVTMDGHPLKDITLKSLRGQMGIVSQDIILLNGSIRDNIKYGKPDASQEEIEAAARAANAHDFIVSFPQGYDSQIGERGVKLSGGQKQRLSIARAILKDPKLVILDEATSSLDTESEKLIQDALDRLLIGRTCIVIAHRLSTVQKADRICVLHKGEILEEGNHESLMALGGKYKQLYELQFPQSKVKPEAGS